MQTSLLSGAARSALALGTSFGALVSCSSATSSPFGANENGGAAAVSDAAAGRTGSEAGANGAGGTVTNGAGGAVANGAGGGSANGAGGSSVNGAGGGLSSSGGTHADAGSLGAAGSGGSQPNDCTPPPPSPLLGWASVSGSGVDSTTGGEGGDTVTVTSLSDLKSALSGTTTRIVVLHGSVDGDVSVGSNKTLVGVCGAEIHGHVAVDQSNNVIIRNLTIVGYDCADSPSDCSGGADAVSVLRGAHHVWLDHDDISDGSDGNLDLTHAADFVTISWTKFHYSGRRSDPAGASGGHQFSDLIGHSDDNASEDTGHLRITFHHSWWADNVVERMPRVRFGRVHLFNDLYTAAGNDYCIGVGNGASILSENNVFIGVESPIKSYSTDGTGVIHSSGNDYRNTTGGTTDVGSGTVFTPPYAVTLDSTSDAEAAVRANAGPKP